MTYRDIRDIRPPMVAVALFLSGAVAPAESALDQLKNTPGARSGGVPDVPAPSCAYCNTRNGNHSGNCPYRPQVQKKASPSSAPALSPSNQMALSLMGGLFNGLMSGMFDDSEREAAEAAAAAAERARIEAQARDYTSHG
jgi:hypothetical protein